MDIQSGVGILASVGCVVRQKPKWGRDVELRYARVPHEGFSTSRLHFALGVSTCRS